MPMTIVTTSWDDGHHTDLRLAERLAAYALKGTFYVALNHPGDKDIGDDEIRARHRPGRTGGTRLQRAIQRRAGELGTAWFQASEPGQAERDLLGVIGRIKLARISGGERAAVGSDEYGAHRERSLRRRTALRQLDRLQQPGAIHVWPGRLNHGALRSGRGR